MMVLAFKALVVVHETVWSQMTELFGSTVLLPRPGVHAVTERVPEGVGVGVGVGVGSGVGVGTGVGVGVGIGVGIGVGTGEVNLRLPLHEPYDLDWTPFLRLAVYELIPGSI